MAMKPRKIKKKPTKKIPGGPTRPAGFAAGVALRKKLKAKAGAKPTAGRQLKATKKPVKKMRKGGLVEKRKEKKKRVKVDLKHERVPVDIKHKRVKVDLKHERVPVDIKHERVKVDLKLPKRQAVTPKLTEKGKGGAVKKMRGGGMVKKMRGGGMVKKMRKGGAVRKKK